MSVASGQKQAPATWVSPGGASLAGSESPAVAPGEGQMGNVGLYCFPAEKSVRDPKTCLRPDAGDLDLFDRAFYEPPKPERTVAHENRRSVDWLRASDLDERLR